MKTTNLIQTRLARFQNGMLGNSWWYWFKHQDLKFNIWQIKWLDIITQSCQSFHNNLQTLYNKHNYNINPIYNLNRTSIQIGMQSGALVLAKWRSHQVYNIIPKSKEWLIFNYVIKCNWRIFARVLHFGGERLHNNYIQPCKARHVWLFIERLGWLISFSKYYCHFSKGQY